jgi:ATP-dependent Clp protease, protease subunit
VTLPGDREPSYAGALRERLFERRVVILNGPLDDEPAAEAAAALMTLDATGDEKVQLLLNCSGGTYDAAFTIIDVIDLLGVPVHATCMGAIEGPPVGVLAVADHRVAAPHTRVRLDEPSSAFEGRAGDVARWADEQRRQQERFCARLAAAMQRPARWVTEAIRKGRTLDVHEAVRYGLVDEIASPRAASVRALSGGTIGFQPGRSRNR